MIRLRALAIVVVLASVLYALLPRARKTRLRGKIREFGRALLVAMVLYWILMIGRAWFAG